MISEEGATSLPADASLPADRISNTASFFDTSVSSAPLFEVRAIDHLCLTPRISTQCCNRLAVQFGRPRVGHPRHPREAAEVLVEGTGGTALTSPATRRS